MFNIESKLFILLVYQPPADSSQPSSLPFIADGHFFTLNYDRDFARPFRILQHGFKMIRLLDYVVIVKLSAFPGKRFTSGPGIGSGIFSVDQDFIGHLSPPLKSLGT